MDDFDQLLSSMKVRLEEASQQVDPTEKDVCSGCKKGIKGNILTAMKCSWHEECFRCGKCSTTITKNDKFYEVENRPLCVSCSQNQRRLPTCEHCNEAILTEKFVDFYGTKFHSEHFFCAFCNIKLQGNRCWEKDQKPACEGCSAINS